MLLGEVINSSHAFLPQFPWILDMEPYTAEGLASREKDQHASPKQLYDLTGIVVHSGQASAGHYYSFIKDKRYIWERSEDWVSIL